MNLFKPNYLLRAPCANIIPSGLGVGLQHKDLEGRSSVHTREDVSVAGRAGGPGPGQSMTLAVEEGVVLGCGLSRAPACPLRTPGSRAPPALNLGQDV